MALTFKSLIFIISILFSYCLGNESNETCLKDEKESCINEETKNIYSKESNSRHRKYISLINEAKANYIQSKSENCELYRPVVLDDLKPFSDGISPEQIDVIKSKGTKYQIHNKRLFREKDCMFPARCSGIEYFLHEIIDELPNIELIVNTRDWPQIYKGHSTMGPVFSFSKTSQYADIMYPAWAFWEGGPAIKLYPTGIGRWDRHRKELGKLGNTTLWKDKIPKAFFRGSRTSSERDPLVILSREKPHLADAQYTKNQAWKSDADTLGFPPASEVSFGEHCRYKYLFNFRGVAASFRFKHVLLCKSVVFHVGNEWIEFFYPLMKPWIHYIPVRANANKAEIEELIEFAVDNDDLVKEIAENGYNFIWNNLKLSTVTCYWKMLLEEYGRLLRYKPKLDAELIEIRKPKY